FERMPDLLDTTGFHNLLFYTSRRAISRPFTVHLRQTGSSAPSPYWEHASHHGTIVLFPNNTGSSSERKLYASQGADLDIHCHHNGRFTFALSVHGPPSSVVAAQAPRPWRGDVQI